MLAPISPSTSYAPSIIDARYIFDFEFPETNDMELYNVFLPALNKLVTLDSALILYDLDDNPSASKNLNCLISNKKQEDFNVMQFNLKKGLYFSPRYFIDDLLQFFEKEWSNKVGFEVIITASKISTQAVYFFSIPTCLNKKSIQ